MLNLSIPKAKRDKIARREYKASGFVKYTMHWDDKTLLTEDNKLIQIIRVGGYSFETADDEDLDTHKST